MREITSEDFIKDLGNNTKHPKPLSGQVELTYCCNLDCIHCYCKGSERKTDELTARQWKDIFDQIYKEGCLWLTITGGEPFLRDDFKEIYAYAHKKGFLISIFTNGTLLSSEIFEFLKINPPYLIEISLFGITEEIYESITQVPGSFQKLWKNVEKYLQMNMPLVLKTVGLKQNKTEILKVKTLAEELLGKKKFKFDSFIFPSLNGDITPCKYRLSPEEILEIENNDADMIDQRQKELHMPDCLTRSREFLYQCDAWKSTFFINPYGWLQFCQLSQRYSCNLIKTDFKDGFYNEFPKLLNEKFTTTSKCKSCALRKYCYFCPARAFLETGSQEGPVEYYCKLAEARFKQKQFLKV